VRRYEAALTLALAVAAGTTFSACRPSAERATPVVKVQHLPPTPKDVIDALLASSQVPLAVDPSCRSVGTEPTDKTIGRYLSGFLAELANAEAKNAIETTIEAQGAVWVCRVMIRHALGEDIWRWGVQFSVRQQDGQVLPDSFRCLGAG
jgi:hypothetical protein